MPKVLTEARSICPELIDAVKIIDDLAYRRSYAEVFANLVDWIVWQHHFPPTDDDPLKNYTAKEQNSFKEMFKIIQDKTKERVNLHSPRIKDKNGWYDPLGRLYECITSKNKSQMMGQYFSPRHVVNVMTEINIGKGDGKFKSVLDPACGSGRMGLSAATQLMLKDSPCWITMNDFDAICTKMTAANMCLNGIIGEALCSDGLDITGETYRFGYRVEPMIMQFPKPMQELAGLMMLAKTGQNIQKQYVLKPVTYEQTYLKGVNDNLLQELEQKQKITEKQQREKEVAEFKETVKNRLKGTLFEGLEEDVSTLNLPSQKKDKNKPPPSFKDKIKKEKPQQKKPPPDYQGRLF